jgi:hypothetical protein
MVSKLTKAHAGPVYGLDRPCPIKIAECMPASPEISDIGTGICHSSEFRAPGCLQERCLLGICRC